MLRMAIKKSSRPLVGYIATRVMKKVDYCLVLLMCIFALLTISCDRDETPVTQPQYRISWIYSDDSYEIFEYDASGRVSGWRYGDMTSKLYESSYSYSEDENSIIIAAEEERGDNIWIFNEELFLDESGKASHARGDVTITDKNREMQLMKKNYAVNFRYNQLRQLTVIDIVEKRIDNYGWEESVGLEWTVELEWDEDNLVRYTEYSNPEHPMVDRTFKYFGGETAHYIPIVQGSILRSYYLPFQYQGILGRQSAGMVKEMMILSYNTNYNLTFSYDIASSIYSSAVEGYSEVRGGREVSYTVAWEDKNGYRFNY